MSYLKGNRLRDEISKYEWQSTLSVNSLEDPRASLHQEARPGERSLTTGLIASSLAILIVRTVESLKEETFLHRPGHRDQPVLRIRLFRGIGKEMIKHLQK